MTATHAGSQVSEFEGNTLRKGLLWQQWDKFFSRWKERFFILTKDYLACFKKGSKIGISEMGSFLFKITLADIENLQWASKKRDGVISLKTGNEGQLLLWTTKGLDEWMYILREAITRSKGRREALRKSSTMGSVTPDGMWRRHLSLQHTLSDSQVHIPEYHNDIKRFEDSLEYLKNVADRHPTPHMGRKNQRISVMTDIDLSTGSSGCEDTDSGRAISEHKLSHAYNSPSKPSPRLCIAPQYFSGSYSSLVSLGVQSISSHLQRPSPRSLQVSPALTQRSLYAQHVLSTPEISRHSNSKRLKSYTRSATSEFSFIRPNSPLGSLSGSCSHLSSNCSSHKRDYQRSQSCTSNILFSKMNSSNVPAESLRPSSVHGQIFNSSQKTSPVSHPPDVVPVPRCHEVKQTSKRVIRPYSHTNSDSAFLSKKLAVASLSDLRYSGGVALR